MADEPLGTCRTAVPPVPTLEAPLLSVRASCPDLGVDFAFTTPVTGHRVDSFTLLLSDLAQAITKGTALDMRQAVTAKAFEARLHRNAAQRAEQHKFYSELSKAYERQSANMHEMRLSYYRELDHLREQLANKSRHLSFKPREDIIFFDPDTYRIPAWKEIAERLLDRRMDQATRDSGGAPSGSRRADMVPLKALCKLCKAKFSVELPAEPQDVAIQTDEMSFQPPEDVQQDDKDDAEISGHRVSRWAQTEPVKVVSCGLQTEAQETQHAVAVASFQVASESSCEGAHDQLVSNKGSDEDKCEQALAFTGPKTQTTKPGEAAVFTHLVRHQHLQANHTPTQFLEQALAADVPASLDFPGMHQRDEEEMILQDLFDQQWFDSNQAAGQEVPQPEVQVHSGKMREEMPIPVEIQELPSMDDSSCTAKQRETSTHGSKQHYTLTNYMQLGAGESPSSPWDETTITKMLSADQAQKPGSHDSQQDPVSGTRCTASSLEPGEAADSRVPVTPVGSPPAVDNGKSEVARQVVDRPRAFEASHVGRRQHGLPSLHAGKPKMGSPVEIPSRSPSPCSSMSARSSSPQVPSLSPGMRLQPHPKAAASTTARIPKPRLLELPTAAGKDHAGPRSRSPSEALSALRPRTMQWSQEQQASPQPRSNSRLGTSVALAPKFMPAVSAGSEARGRQLYPSLLVEPRRKG